MGVLYCYSMLGRIHEIIMDWIKANAISLTVGFATLVSTYAIYGWQIGEAYRRIENLEVSASLGGTDAKMVSERLVRIETTVEYIKEQIDRRTVSFIEP